MISPGIAKITLMSWARSHGPRNPCKPKIKTRKSPTTTGDTANGRSMNAVRSARPGNLKRAIAHAAATPKTMFASTAAGATINVSFTECKVSGSPSRFSKYKRSPPASAW